MAAEEQIYDQVESGGDPDPLGLRRQLNLKKKGSSDPLGLRAKVTVAKVAAKAPSVSLPFQSASDWLSIPQGYQPIVAENVVSDHGAKVYDSKSRVSSHLNDIDQSVRNLIYEHKKYLTGTVKSDQLAVNPRESGPANIQAQEIESQLREDIPVSPLEVQEFKVGMNENQIMLRQGLAQKAKDLSKSDVSGSRLLKADIYRLDRQNSPEKDDKISKNIEKINEGEYDYDVVNGRLIKPEGFFASLATGFKQKNEAYKDYDVYRSGDEREILKLINKRLKDDPDDAIPHPSGVSGEAGAMIGGQPLKPLVAGGVAGYFSGGTAAAAAAAAVSAPEMYKLTFGSTLPNNFAALKKQNPSLSDSEILQKAIDLTDQQANADALGGAAMGAIGARAGFKPTGINSALLNKSVGSALKQLGETAAKKTLEGLGAGSAGAAGQLVKNLMAQKAGIPVDESDGLAQQLIAGVQMTMVMTMIAKTPELLKPKTYNQLLQSLKGVPAEVINENLDQLQSVGEITQEQAQSAQESIKQHAAIDNSIKPGVPESERLKVQQKIKERNQLEAEMEAEDKAYQPETKEKVKALNEQIVNITNGAERGELQKLVDGEKKSGNIDGFVTDVLVNASENDLRGYFKEIADQAYDPNSEATTIATFGENIVKKAKELYPKEVKESKVSVIRPGEIKQPESITIKPKEDAISVGGPEATIVDETTGYSQPVGEGVSESGEAPIPQEGSIPVQEGTPAGQEGLGEPRMVGITHAQMNELADEWGLPKYEGSPERVSEWDQQAASKLANDPNALPDLFNKLRNGIPPDAVETRMMLQYFGDLMGKVERDPYNVQLQDQALRTKDLFNIAGRIQGKALVARKGFIPAEERMGDFIIRDREANRAPLTEEQTRQSVFEFEEIKKVKDEYDAKVAKLKAENAKLKSQKVVEKAAKEAKKDTKKDYKGQRKEIIADIKKKWDSHKGRLSAAIVPYADRLVDIAPDVMKLVRNVVEEGIEKLPDVIRSVHNQLKDFMDITEDDVHDIIAGKFNKEKTRGEISEKLYDLRTEAKLIRRLEALEAGIEPKNEKAKRKRSIEIEGLKEQIGEHDLTRLAAHKKRIQNEINKLEDQIRKGDFINPEKNEVPLDDEAIALKDRLIELRQQREKRLAQLELENRTKLEKARDVATEILGVPRTLMASADFSAPLRQGVVATISHPSVASKAAVEMFRQAFSKKSFDRWLNDLKSSPEYKLMEDSGLYIADPNDLRLQAKEELFMTNLGEKIPVVGEIVKGSERGYVAYLNKMRADLFKQGAEVFADQGRTFANSPELYKGLARYINNATGRGGLGPLEKSAQVLNTAFFSPRLIASRLNLLNPVFYVKLPKEVRMMALKDMRKLITFGTSVLWLASLAGADVEKDPRSSDFGKIRVGNTRWDIWGGFQQYVRLLFQELYGETKSSNTGAIYELKGDKFPYKTRLDQLGSFFRGKLAPVPGTSVDMLAGKNVVGKEFDPSEKAYELFVPMIAQDIQEAWKEQGPKSILTTGVPSAFGIGVTTYDKPAPKQSATSGKKSKRTNPHKKD